MAAPEAPTGRGPLKAITRKVGPLPLWAYAVILVAGYWLWRRSHPSSSSPSDTAGVPQSDQAYVPGFDAAGAGGGGGIGDTGVPQTINYYYYGDTAAQQAGGGGTSPGPAAGGPTTPSTPTTSRTTTPVDVPGFTYDYPGIHYSGPGGSGTYHPLTSNFVPSGVTPTPGKFTAV